MSAETDLPLSSLLEKANHIKNAMSNIEKEITNNSFEVKHEGIQIEMRGTYMIEKIILDPEKQQKTTEQILPDLISTINKAVSSIEQKRQNAFKEISNNMVSPSENP